MCVHAGEMWSQIEQNKIYSKEFEMDIHTAKFKNDDSSKYLPVQWNSLNIKVCSGWDGCFSGERILVYTFIVHLS